MKHKKNKTELIFLIDRSESMLGYEKDTADGFNNLIDEQRRRASENTRVTTFFFDDKPEILHDRVELRKIARLREYDYRVQGCTALLDAIGKAIDHISAKNKDTPDRVIFAIITDGFENSSTEYTWDEIRQKVNEKSALGWKFLFLGADMDAIGEAAKYGISSEKAIEYTLDSQGIAQCYETLSNMIDRIKRSAPINHDCLK